MKIVVNANFGGFGYGVSKSIKVQLTDMKTTEPIQNSLPLLKITPMIVEIQQL